MTTPRRRGYTLPPLTDTHGDHIRRAEVKANERAGDAGYQEGRRTHVDPDASVKSRLVALQEAVRRLRETVHVGRKGERL